MIVKILSSSRTFKGVRYNTDKIDSNKGELAKVVNFGPLQVMDKIRPEDYVNYFKMISAQNKNIKSPQFHVAISTKGRKHSKEELTNIAEKWLKKMGYSNQPYLIIFHKDTKNNHVHIVSSRVDRDGIKISSAFEKIRAIQNLNQVIGVREDVQAQQHFEKAMAFNFTTKAQFMMILESYNYTIGDKPDRKEMIKFGKVVGEFSIKAVEEKISKTESELLSDYGELSAKDRRRNQLVAFFHKYLNEYSSKLFKVTEPLPGGREKPLSAYSSSFAGFMRQKLGVELIFHATGAQQPYGYSVVDHSERFVFKGSEIMDLQDLLKERLIDPPEITITGTPEGLNHITNEVDSDRISNSNKSIADDDPINLEFQAYEELTDFDYEDGQPLTNSSTTLDYQKEVFQDFHPNSPDVSIDIADDIDDEAILGRNRRRQKKARTNTR